MKTPHHLLLILLAAIVGAAWIVAAFCAWENWRGARVWEATRHDLEARGEHLDWASFTPSPIPDDQNLAFAPLFVRELGYAPNSQTGVLTASHWPPCEFDDLRAMPYGMAASLTGWHLPGPTANTAVSDLCLLQRSYRRQKDFPRANSPGAPVADVLLALTRYAPILDQLARAAETRPLTRFPLDWRGPNLLTVPFVPCSFVAGLVNTLRLRASVELTAGRTADAIRNVDLGLRLCRDGEGSPRLVEYAEHNGDVGMMLAPVWQGLAERRWLPAELARLQAALCRVDLLADYAHAVRAERAGGLMTMEYFLSQKKLVSFLQETSLDWKVQETGPLVQLAPRGWFDQNRAQIALLEQRLVTQAVDPKLRRVSPVATEAILRDAADSGWPYHPLSKYVLPFFGHQAFDAARGQTRVDQAVASCALERFYLDRQTYPASLSALVPDYLDRVPIDVIDGASLRYLQTPDGRYRLWSVGWDGRDDGGKVAWQEAYPKNTFRADDAKGDWVWQYAPFQPPLTIQRNK